MKRGIFSLIFLALLASLIPIISAEIYISELHSVYNVGDKVIANVTLSSSVDTIGFFSAYLICGFEEIETFKSIESVNAGEQKIVSVVSIIDNSIVGSLTGECYIRTLYGSGEARSQPFRISRSADVEIKVNNIVFLPGETINISGRVIKENREPLKGFVDIVLEGINIKLPSNSPPAEEIIVEDEETNSTINETSESVSEETDEDEETESNETIEEEISTESENETSQESVLINQTIILGSLSAEVIDGFYSAGFQIPENAPPGEYSINVYARDFDRQGLVMSSGASSSLIEISQSIRGIDIILSTSSIAPRSEFFFTPLLFDQAGNYGEGDIEINVYAPDQSLFSQSLIKASETISWFIEANQTPGFWVIEAKSLDFQVNKELYVEEFPELSSTIAEGMLVITNTGNIPYSGPLEIKIGEKSQVININLELGESIRFELEAPDGEYDININDGRNPQNLGKMFLTGNAIGINEVKGFFIGNMGIWLWTLIIVILIIMILIIVRKILRKKDFGKFPRIVTPSIKSPLVTSSSPVVSNVMDHGTREEALIIALKIKNLQELQRVVGSGNPLESIDRALLQAKSAKAKIYVDNDYRIMIFLPSITRTNENEPAALNAAKEIEAILQNHNKSSIHKISFGIGVNSGNIAVELKDGRLKFVSLDNTVTIAKRIADYSEGFVLLSDQIHKKLLGKLRVEKIEGTNYWRLQRLPNHSNYEDFIQKFLNRERKS